MTARPMRPISPLRARDTVSRLGTRRCARDVRWFSHCVEQGVDASEGGRDGRRKRAKDGLVLLESGEGGLMSMRLRRLQILDGNSHGKCHTRSLAVYATVTKVFRRGPCPARGCPSASLCVSEPAPARPWEFVLGPLWDPSGTASDCPRPLPKESQGPLVLLRSGKVTAGTCARHR